MTEEVPCLLRVGDNVKKYKIFKLDRDQVTIGRSGDVTYALLSNMISRCHAIIKRQENTWTITDNKSLNGIYINGRQLAPHNPYTLQEGDMVQLGVPTVPDAPADFVYKFYSSLRVRIEKKNAKRLKTEGSAQEDKDTLSAGESLDLGDDQAELKRKKAVQRIENTTNNQESPSKVLRQRMEESQKQQAAREAEYQARLEEMEKLLKEKEAKEREVQEELERERLEKENQAKEVEELKQKEHAILMEMLTKQEQLEKEKEELRLKMQAELEANLKEREATLMAQLTSQKEALLREKKQVEESLQNEMEKALEEKNKELEQQLLDQKQKLEKVLEKKDMEQKVLESQLNETKEESETAKLQALKAREDILSNFVDLMEMELQCTICNELFIKATSLNCAHVFCKLCIGQWMKVKKECPNCRTPVTSQLQAIALDSYIDKMVEQLNDEMKKRRAELVAQRKIEQDKFDGLVAGPSHTMPATAATGAAPNTTATSTASTTAPRRGGRNRTAARGRNRPTAAATRAAATAAVRALRAAAATLTTTAAPTFVATTATVTAASSTSTAAPSTSTSTTTSTTNPAIIELSDDSNSSNNSEDSDDSYGRYGRRRRGYNPYDDSDEGDSDEVEGDPDAYYGGYGRCYNCGMRGHWANGCPDY